LRSHWLDLLYLNPPVHRRFHGALEQAILAATMKTDWNRVAAQAGEQLGAPVYSRTKPISDRVKLKMVRVLRDRNKLASPRLPDRSLIRLMKDSNPRKSP
jgi:hypothetical protein